LAAHASTAYFRLAGVSPSKASGHRASKSKTAAVSVFALRRPQASTLQLGAGSRVSVPPFLVAEKEMIGRAQTCRMGIDRCSLPNQNLSRSRAVARFRPNAALPWATGGEDCRPHSTPDGAVGDEISKTEIHHRHCPSHEARTAPTSRAR
jgi:hypothetical protein